MKFIVLTFGIGALIVNSLIFYGVCCLIPGVSLEATDAFLIPSHARIKVVLSNYSADTPKE